VDGLRASVGGGSKTPHLIAHLAELGLTGPDSVLIGDSVDDAHAADAVGAGCVLYSDGFTDSERLRATRKLVARSLSEAVELMSRSCRRATPPRSGSGCRSGRSR
jgi:phosphoglycolate phosphatase-like HAD superfamily hydrolase